MRLIAVLALSLSVSAQQPGGLTLNTAVESALRNYPSVQVTEQQLNAAGAAIGLARTAYLPRVDALAQANRATRNNVFGLLLPQGTIPTISGPVLGTNNFGSAWGSAAGVLITWEPFDFGLRRANVAVAASAQAQSAAAVRRTRFEVAVSAADAFLTLVAAQETTGAAQAGLDRAKAILQISSALVNAQLRAGADESRARVEVAAARNQVIRAEQAVETARANVERFVGGQGCCLAVSAERLLESIPETAAVPPKVDKNPVLEEQGAVIEQARAQLRALERSYFPRFALQGSAYARGTGAEVDGRLLGGLHGLGPNTQNYAVGLTVTFPVMDYPAIQAREAAQAATVKAGQARAAQIASDLKAQWNSAAATVEGARKLAANAPVLLEAARAASVQETARYRAGLENFEQVAESERLLTQAEIDARLARLAVWRGLLAIAAAAGDLQPFLLEAAR
ncbi:MAG: TolC family protein [Acidobacteriota bacterium]|nr:TolC family protein [Acidobacteriota bacterium]